MSNVKKKVNKNRIQPCKICEQNHLPEVQFGNSVGDGGELAVSIAGGGDVEKYKKAHDFYNPRESKSKPGKIHPQMEAHHLICSESMDDEEEEGGELLTWMDICNCFGYDLNCKENGVFLPSCLEVACAHKVPLHRGNHNATVGDGYLNYVNSVKKKITPTKNNAKQFCKSPGKFKEKMDSISKDIFDLVKAFTWTLTADGRDYKRKIGCLNKKSFNAKRKEVLGNALKGDVVAVVKDATEKALKDEIFCDPQKHENKKLRQRISYDLKISK